MDYGYLMEEALKARKAAYAPYSGFQVGAVLLCADGSIYTGCNVENSSYGAACCAERTAFFKAVSEGKRSFRAIAVVGGKKDGEVLESCPPCGICRQVMREFCSSDLPLCWDAAVWITIFIHWSSCFPCLSICFNMEEQEISFQIRRDRLY